jgi:pentatricopeptide repeat protein
MIRLRRIAVGSTATALVCMLVSIWVFQRQEMKRQASIALLKEQDAERQSQVSKALMSFQQILLTAANPYQGGDQDMSVLQWTNAAATALENGSFDAQPLVAAALCQMIGNTFRSLSHPEQAEPLLRKALDIRRAHPEERAALAQAYNDLGQTLHDQEKLVEAEAQYVKALEIRRQIDGQRDAFVEASLTALGILYTEICQGRPQDSRLRVAKEYLSEALLRAKAVGAPRNIVASQNALARALVEQGEFEDAERLFRSSLELCIQRKLPQEDLGLAQSDLAWCLARKGDPNREALALARESVARLRSVFKPDHRNVLDAEKILAKIEAEEQGLNGARIAGERQTGNAGPTTNSATQPARSVSLDNPPASR